MTNPLLDIMRTSYMIRRLREWQEKKAEQDRDIAKRQYWQALSGCMGMQTPLSPFQSGWVNGHQYAAMQNQQGTAAQLYQAQASNKCFGDGFVER